MRPTTAFSMGVPDEAQLFQRGGLAGTTTTTTTQFEFDCFFSPAANSSESSYSTVAWLLTQSPTPGHAPQCVCLGGCLFLKRNSYGNFKQFGSFFYKRF
jgi:hypothetical protein